MKAYKVKYDWMPPVSQVPLRVQKALMPFTPMRWGWAIWYQGKTRTVCGKTVELADVPARWEKLKSSIDAQTRGEQKLPDRRTLREALSDYFKWLDYREKTGKPKPLAVITGEGYKKTLMEFAKFEIAGRKLADRMLSELGPEEFRGFAEYLSKRAPSSFSRIVAAVYAFFNYCRDEGLLLTPPNYGRYFVRPPQSNIRDRRMGQQKAWEPQDLWAIVEHAGVIEKAWIGLALSGAMDNADIGHLTFGLFDETGLLLDYRRRKTGLMPRLIPIHSVAREWLDDYLKVRPKPVDSAWKELVFLTPTGLPLQRMRPGKSGIGYQADYIRPCWDKLLQRAGMRRQARVRWVCVLCGKLRPKPRAKCCGQCRWKRQSSSAAVGGPDYKGFRSLRTTFANLVPRGFSDERKLIMGHAGDITLNHYIERFGSEHLRKLVEEVWRVAFTAPLATAASQK